MGRPKLILPWRDTTVIGQVARVLAEGGVERVVVVTGRSRELIERALIGTGAWTVFNPAFEAEEMLASIQVGLRSLPESCEAALIALGDQPQIRASTVRAIVREYRESGSPIVCPSYRMRRGHPFLLSRAMFAEVLRLRHPQTIRDLLNRHAQAIRYVESEDESVLMDIDTPEDYEQGRPAER